MTRRALTRVRAFDGSRADADGLLAVERASFDECPYSPRQIQRMLTDGPQRAWLALARDVVVGFVVGFATNSLRGPVWEVDLLAVRPSWQGRGLAIRLVRAACDHGARISPQTRSVVSVDNRASAQVFRRAGFRAPKQPCQLWILRVQERPVPAAPIAGAPVRALNDVADLRRSLSGSGLVPPGDPAKPTGPPSAGGEFQFNRTSMPRFLVAGTPGTPEGHADLLEVQTLLYQGLWIELLTARAAPAREALVRETLVRARAAGLEEVGAMVPAADLLLPPALERAGFRSLGEFHEFETGLPLPGWAGPPMDGGGPDPRPSESDSYV